MEASKNWYRVKHKRKELKGALTELETGPCDF